MKLNMTSIKLHKIYIFLPVEGESKSTAKQTKCSLPYYNIEPEKQVV